MKVFHYIKPSNLADAISALREHDDAFLLSGGTDLLVGIKNKLLEPKCIIDLKGIPSLNVFKYESEFRFGSLLTIRDVEVSKAIREKIPVLCQAASCLGSVQIRNKATVGGNLCNASPAADMSTIFLAMDADVKVVSQEGEKVIELEHFFVGPNSTILGRNDILTEIIVSKDVAQFKGTYMKYGPRKAMDIGVVNIAILLDADFKSGFCKKISIALGSVAPTPIRAKKAEYVLSGNTLSPQIISEAAEVASSETDPISDLRASAGYRKELVRTLVAAGIKKILESNET
ncbi:MAG: xanthine dehydrogenase family protein subunit M [Proteobacteria bacterium]|nr:xanthine dehydrogenase family protein subunit M [Pseudomonadota bacterium]